MKAVSTDAYALHFATAELRGDRDIVMKSLSQAGNAHLNRLSELRRDHEVHMKLQSEGGYYQPYATAELRGDREIVMKAISRNPSPLKYASEELRGDREIVMKAVSKDWATLRFASEELRSDCEIVMKAVSQNIGALNHVAEELMNNTDVLKAARVNVSAESGACGLKVNLLSGRQAIVFFRDWNDNMDLVMTHVARALDLDRERVLRSGTLWQGTMQIKQLRDLRGKPIGGQLLHEVTLVISS